MTIVWQWPCGCIMWWFPNGGRMHRKGSGRTHGKQKAPGKGKPGENNQETIHRRNLHVAAVPAVAFFNAIRFLAFQLWVLLSLLCRAGAYVIPARRTKTTVTCGSHESEAGNTHHQQHSQQLTAVTEQLVYADMASRQQPNAGPGEPALAKQKHHHRKAFEYISKALKLDEENTGTCTVKVQISLHNKWVTLPSP